MYTIISLTCQSPILVLPCSQRRNNAIGYDFISLKLKGFYFKLNELLHKTSVVTLAAFLQYKM